MARPRSKVDPAMVRRLAAVGASVTTMAKILDCSTDTLHRRFASEIEKGRAEGDVVILDGLFKLAQKQNLGALIWLSKNRLGYTDKVEAKNESSVSLSAPQLSIEQIKDLLK